MQNPNLGKGIFTGAKLFKREERGDSTKKNGECVCARKQERCKGESVNGTGRGTREKIFYLISVSISIGH